MQNTVKVLVIFLVVAIIALVIGIFYVMDKSRNDLRESTARAKDLEMEVEALNGQLKQRKDQLDQKEQNEAALKSQLEEVRKAQEAMAEQLAKATNDLVGANAKLVASTRSMEKLNSEKTSLQGSVTKLNTKVASLNDKIKKLEDELVRGENNRELLLKELASLRIEKANMEKQFNDIGEIRTQYKKLRHDEILENRRRWIAQGYSGFYTKTGVYETPKPYVSKASEYDMKAEIHLKADTNRPPHSISDKPGGL